MLGTAITPAFPSGPPARRTNIVGHSVHVKHAGHLREVADRAIVIAEGADPGAASVLHGASTHARTPARATTESECQESFSRLRRREVQLARDLDAVLD